MSYGALWARIAVALSQSRAATADQIAERVGCEPKTVRKLLWKLKHAGVADTCGVHVPDETRPGHRAYLWAWKEKT